MNRRIALFAILFLASCIIFSGTTATSYAKTFTVNSDASLADATPGDGICATSGGNCTMHAAMEEANLDGEYSTIRFASRFQSTHSIDGCSLPALTEDNTTIDASEWWDSTNERPGVEITGGACTLLSINASGTTVLGLFFGGSSSTGVHINTGTDNRIGGFDTGQRNVFLVGQYGVWVQSLSNYVTNNYIGTVDGKTLPGGSMGTRGVFVQTGTESANVISTNLIAGQSDAGIYLWDGGNVVSENIIGLDRYKSSALPNQVGIVVSGDQNMIGNNNVIAGNIDHGVKLSHAQHTSILNNDIGYFWDQSVDLSNGGDGVHVHVSDNTQLGRADNGNRIGYNSGNGIFVYASTGIMIQGNDIYENSEDGIHFNDSSGIIGGKAAGERNSIDRNSGDGVHLNNSTNVTVQANFLGLSNGNSGAGNRGYGVLVDGASYDNIIGGENEGEGNRIGFNDRDGIRLSGSTTHDNDVLGNILGAPVSASWQVPNGNHGISIYNGAYNNKIGSLDGGNVVLASGWSGVVIVNSSNNAVIANRIGTDGADKQWGNTYYGVHVAGNGSGNSITFNEIAYNGTHNGTDNGEAGIRIDGAWANTISRNSIHDNDGPGIELINGGNINLAAPVISTAGCSGPVTGTAGGPGWIVEVFSDSSNEGGTFEGTATADGGGNWSWSGMPGGPNLTATARAPSDDTSPFSAVFKIGNCNSSLLLFMPAILGAATESMHNK